ncbi:MAG: penicillin-insensitive murein endopeptidase [Deltaproteobacteria bacterium]|nr:penicillin-insensitive murein endopeptidase [Deltaproteobacteria bacterium]MDQ3297238.1 penicillin-insensitive murein endopeptidase [Myxococcota bacterium]
MRFLAIAAFASLATGCAELGVIHDGTSISIGRPNRGRIVDGVRLPNRGDGFMTRSTWQTRGNRYGTDELVDLITAVSRRLVIKTNGVRLVVADLSGRGGGESRLWHRSHQNGRDVDLLYFVRDADGKPVEPEVMHVFKPDGSAKDGSGLHVDVPRTWHLVRELVTAPEATVQWVFMYEPIATKLLEYAQQSGEPEALIARARKALKQPGDSAPHNDHMHVRVYCSVADRAYGCQDIGQRELLAEREAELAAQTDTIAAAFGGSGAPVTTANWSTAASATPPAPVALQSIGRKLLRTRSHRLDLRRWR